MVAVSLIILLGFFAALSIVSVFRSVAYRFNLLDIPNARSSHHLPIPNAGGIGVVASFFLGIFLLFAVDLVSINLLVSILVGGVLLAGIGLLDDARDLSARVRIFIHFMAASFALFVFNGMPPLDLGFCVWHWQTIGLVVGLLGLVWLINLYNFMDGIDGLAASEAIFVASAMALLLFLQKEYSLVPVCLLLAACVTGFLIWNWSPARVFMGDTGSGFLGFVFGILLLSSIWDCQITPWQWLILLGCFWVDATLTLILRMIRKEAWYQAHCSHAFQQAVKRIGCHKQVVLCVLLINVCWLLPIAILTIYYPKWTLLLTGIAIMPLIVVCLLLKAGISSNSDSYQLNNLI